MNINALNAIAKPHSLYSHTLHCYCLIGLTLACLFQDGYQGSFMPSLISTLGMGLALISPAIIIYLRKIAHNCYPNLPVRYAYIIQFILLWTPASLLLLKNPTGYYFFGCIACGYLGLLSTIINQS